MLYAGIKKSDIEGYRKQARLGLTPTQRNQTPGHTQHQWKSFVARVPKTESDSTLQVEVGTRRTYDNQYRREVSNKLEFYTNSETLKLEGVLHRNHVAPTLDLQYSLEFVKSRLQKCADYHSCMPQEPSVLPRRVLNVGSEEVSNIFLYETRGETAPYITLSHCWRTKQILQTTKENYYHRRIGIAWSKLPKTFKDAIQLTRALHIQYLWIDSLCIIQGDTLDWEEQSALMANIYSNCYLNIAATAAFDNNGGLFSKRWIPSIHMNPGQRKRHSVKARTVSSTSDLGQIFVRRSLENAHIDVLVLEGEARNYNVVESAPLLTRAWAYQERLWSPRSVNFHSAELSWDCGEGFDCECGQLSDQDPWSEFNGNNCVLPKYRFVGDWPPKGYAAEAMLDAWLDVVTHFSRLQLTFSKDKLPALAGIAKQIANKTDSEYLAGIWRADVGRGLLWRVDFRPGEDVVNLRNVGARAQPYRAPTWSWASVDVYANRPCSVWISYDFLAPGFDLDIIDERFQVLDGRCDVAGSNPYGCVTGGYLRVKGAALATTMIYDGSPDADTNNGRELGSEEGYDWYVGIESDLRLSYYDFDIRAEGDSHITDGEAIIALLISAVKGLACAILLVASKKEAGKYERFGICELRLEAFEDVEEMVLEII